MVKMRLLRDAYCGFPEALRAIHLFAVLYGESRLAALGRPGIEFICEPLDDEPGHAAQSREVFFVHWSCPPRFQVPALSGVVSAKPNGLTTTITLDAMYEAEIGIVGALFDRFVGRRFVKEATTAFFAQLVRFIEQEAGLDFLLNHMLSGGKPTGRA